MGWFSRRSDGGSSGDGLYTGDAPVSMPGTDGSAPTAYRSTQRTSSSAPAPDWNPDAPPVMPDPTGPTVQPGVGTYAYPDQQGAPSPGYQPWPQAPWQPGAAPTDPNAAGYPVGGATPPWQPGATPPTATMGGQGTAQPGAQPPWTPGLSAEEMMSAEYWQQFGRQVMTQVDRPIVVHRRRASRIVGLFVLIFVAGVAAAVAIPIISAVKDMPSFGGTPEKLTTTPDAQLGTPAAASYRSAELQITMTSLTAQPVDAWRAAEAKPEPFLVAAITIGRTDDGADTSGTVSVMAWDWHFQPVEGAAVDGELISSYEPNLSSPALGAGDEESGLVSFATGARSGTIWLEDPISDQRVAVWKVTDVAVPATVKGSAGKPAQGQIGMPRFTLTLKKSSWLAADDEDLWNPPDNGAILKASLTVKAEQGASSSDYLGMLYATDFWFVPAKGKAVQAGRALLPGATSAVAMYGGYDEPVVVAFDVRKGPGTLELRDAAGKVVIRWAVK